MNNRINDVINDLTAKGYFKLSNGNVKRFNKIYGAFEELQRMQFYNFLKREYLSVNDVNEYLYYIINNLNEFPVKQFKNYDAYVGLSKNPSFKSVEDDFMTRFYTRNNNNKNPDIALQESNISNHIQILINHDVFNKDYKDLYHYDIENKAFILVDGDNIASIINCADVDLANDVLSNGLLYADKLINVSDIVDAFSNARNRDALLVQYSEDYNYITNLISSFKLD